MNAYSGEQAREFSRESRPQKHESIQYDSSDSPEHSLDPRCFGGSVTPIRRLSGVSWRLMRTPGVFQGRACSAGHHRCVRCESRAAEGRREDPIGGTERRGDRSRRWNRRAAAAASERAERGSAGAWRRRRMRTGARAGDEGARTAAPEQCTAAAGMQAAVSEANRRASPAHQ